MSQDQSSITLFRSLLTMPPKGMIKTMNSCNITMNSRDTRGLTLLILASMLGNSNKIKECLALGAEINAQQHSKVPIESYTEKGNTALIWAIANANVDAAKLLINQGADPNIVSLAHSYEEERVGGNTALTLAAAKGYSHRQDKYATRPPMSEVIDLLIEKGADLNYRNFAGKSAIDYAIFHRDNDLINILVSRGVKIGQEHIALLEISHENVSTELNKDCHAFTILPQREWESRSAETHKILTNAMAKQVVIETMATSPIPNPSATLVNTTSKPVLVSRDPF